MGGLCYITLLSVNGCVMVNFILFYVTGWVWVRFVGFLLYVYLGRNPPGRRPAKASRHPLHLPQSVARNLRYQADV